MSNRLDPREIITDLATGTVGRRVVGAVAGVATTEPAIHLSFDDGPHPEVTPRVLETLRNEDIRASFFVRLDRAQTRPDLIEEMMVSGHTIGLHSRTHPKLPDQKLGRIKDEVWDARKDLEEITGKPVKWFRPPHGAQDIRSLAITRLAGMRVLLWTADCYDWLDRPIDELLPLADPNLLPGRIMLMHDTPPSEESDPDFKPELVARLIQHAHDRGVRFIGLDELLALGPPLRRVSLRHVRRRPEPWDTVETAPPVGY